MAFPLGIGVRPEQSKKNRWFTITLILASFAIFSFALHTAGGGPITLQSNVLCGAGILLALSIYYGWKSDRASLQHDSTSEKPVIEITPQNVLATREARIQVLLFIIGVAVFIGALFA